MGDLYLEDLDMQMTILEVMRRLFPEKRVEIKEAMQEIHNKLAALANEGRR